jgi:chloramphenicol 3-O phosphotransferase
MGAKVAKGKIILLNGASSSGKTCIAKELQKLLKEPYMHLGIDTVFTMIPRKCKCYGPSRLKAFVWTPKHNQHAEVQISVGFLGHKVMTGFHRACATLSSSGINLVIDHVLFKTRWLRECFELFAPFDVCFVGVFCPIEILEKRERERGDRQIGLARFTALQAHKGKQYDIVVDTSSSSARQCANQIIDYMTGKRPARIHSQLDFGNPMIQTS